MALVDLEIALRPLCKRIIVKGKPLSGAHLLLTTERIAVRTYYPCGLQELQEKEQAQSGTTGKRKRQSNKEGLDNDDEDNFDSLSTFFSFFQLAIVLFVIPHSKNDLDITIAQQLEDTDSHFHRAQRLATKLETKRDSSIAESKKSGKNLRVIILPDTKSAIDALTWVASSTTQEKTECKKVFFERLAASYYLPSTGNSVQTKATETAAARYVAESLQGLAREFALPQGEMNVLMASLGTLKDIAVADGSLLLERALIDQRTTRFLHEYFGSAATEKGIQNFRRKKQKCDNPFSDQTKLARQLLPPSSSAMQSPRPIPSSLLCHPPRVDEAHSERTCSLPFAPTNNVNPARITGPFTRAREDEIPELDDCFNISIHQSKNVQTSLSFQPAWNQQGRFGVGTLPGAQVQRIPPVPEQYYYNSHDANHDILPRYLDDNSFGRGMFRHRHQKQMQDLALRDNRCPHMHPYLPEYRVRYSTQRAPHSMEYNRTKNHHPARITFNRATHNSDYSFPSSHQLNHRFTQNQPFPQYPRQFISSDGSGYFTNC